MIIRQAGIMSRLVDDLLEAARMCRGSIVIRKERVDIAAMVARTAADIRPLFESRGQQLDVARAGRAGLARGRPDAAGSSPDEPAEQRRQVHRPRRPIDLIATDDREAGEIVLRVRDTGIGLAPEALTHIFELFSQAVPTRDRARGGLGIGLALVKTLVELHGGTVSADSPGPGRGSEFVVRLPAAGRSHVGASPQRPTPGGTTEPGPSARCRLVRRQPDRRRLAEARVGGSHRDPHRQNSRA